MLYMACAVTPAVYKRFVLAMSLHIFDIHLRCRFVIRPNYLVYFEDNFGKVSETFAYEYLESHNYCCRIDR